MFYLNNFLKSSFVIWISTDNPQVNFFDNSTVGNYWSNYNGTDANGDGIGDSTYNIDSNNKDNYPLMLPINFPNTSSNPSPSPSLMATLSPSPTIPEFATWEVISLIIFASAFLLAFGRRVKGK